MDQQQFDQILQEWKTLKRETAMSARDMVPGVPIVFNHIDPEKLMRRHEIARKLNEIMDEYKLSQEDRWEIQLDQ